MSFSQSMVSLISRGEVGAMQTLLDKHPELVHVRLVEDEISRSVLAYAAKLGQLAICRLLIDRGAEIYPNPLNQYPPIIEAAWAKHNEIVDYFLNEIPHLAEGTQGLGVTINLAGRQGWTEIVRKHIERDPLSVHARGWIGGRGQHLLRKHPPGLGFHGAEIADIDLVGGGDPEEEDEQQQPAQRRDGRP